MRVIMSAVRIAIAVAVVNGALRTALVYWSYYQFQDAAQQMAILGWKSSPEVLRSTAFDKANNLLIPIAEDQIVVTRDGPKTLISANYEHPVEYFPNRTYPLKLAFRVEGVNLSVDSVIEQTR
jgi:hypothetical protein